MIRAVILAGAVLVPSLPRPHVLACVATFAACAYLWGWGGRTGTLTHHPRCCQKLFG